MGPCSRRSKAPNDFPEAKTYYPTLEEFQDFPAFVKKVEAEDAHVAGICKIVCPDGWVARKDGYDVDGFNFRIQRPVEQKMNPVGEDRGIKGVFQARASVFKDDGMTIREYRDMANSHKYSAPKYSDYDDLERKYWKNIRFVPPVYGADVTQAITDPEVKGFNIAKLDSPLKHLQEDTGKIYYGVNSPYLYFGMWKATFTWHVEDMDLYGINFVHHGAPKTWYCVPPKYGHLLERAAADLFPQPAGLCTSFLRHKIALMSPEVLDRYGVPYHKVVQEARNIIIVFPYAYHSGFNHGFNIAESTNFASERWIEYGKRHRPCDCMTKTVKIDMTGFVRRFQPHLLEKWNNGTDIGPHPEDPEELKKEINERAKNPRAFAIKKEQKARRNELILVYKTKEGKSLMCDPVRKDILFRSLDWNEEEEARYKAWKAEMENVVCVDVYRHIELSHVEVKVNPVTMECSDFNGFAFLKARLGRPHIKNFQGLVDCGEMYKVDRKMVHRDEIRERDHKKEERDPVKEALRSSQEDDEDGDDDKENKNKNRKAPVKLIKREAPEPSGGASNDDDSDVESYYSSSDQGDEDDSSGDDDSKNSSNTDSEYDDPDFGKPKKKRRKLSKKAMKKLKQERKRRRAAAGDRFMELDGFAMDISKLVRTMAGLREGEEVPEELKPEVATTAKAKTSNGLTYTTSGTTTDSSSVDDTSPMKSANGSAEPAVEERVVANGGETEVNVQHISSSENGHQQQHSNGEVAAAASPQASSKHWVGRGETLRLDWGRLVRERRMSAEARTKIAVAMPVLEGLNIIEKEEGSEHPIWHGAGKDRLVSALEDALGGMRLVEEEGEEKWWPLAQQVIAIFLESDGKRKLSLYRFQEVLFYPDRLEEALEASEKIRTIVQVLMGLRLVVEPRRGRYRYRGPQGVYHEYKRKLFEEFKAEVPRLMMPTLQLKRVEVPPELAAMLTEKKKKLFRFANPSSNKSQHILDRTKNVDMSTLTDLQRRALENLKKKCRCGTKVADPSGKKASVTTGVKRRTRCGKCDGCRADRCLRCINCLNPRNKQTCIQKICLFPILPKCPCFQ